MFTPKRHSRYFDDDNESESQNGTDSSQATSARNSNTKVPSFDLQLVLKTNKSQKRIAYRDLNSMDRDMPIGVVEALDLRYGMRVQIVKDDHKSILDYQEIVPTHANLDDYVIDMSGFNQGRKTEADLAVRTNGPYFEAVTECSGHADELFYQKLIDMIMCTLNYALTKRIYIVTFHFVSTGPLNSDLELDSMDTFCTTLLKNLLNFDYQFQKSMIFVRILSSRAPFVKCCQENFLRFLDAFFIKPIRPKK